MDQLDTNEQRCAQLEAQLRDICNRGLDAELRLMKVSKTVQNYLISLRSPDFHARTPRSAILKLKQELKDWKLEQAEARKEFNTLKAEFKGVKEQLNDLLKPDLLKPYHGLQGKAAPHQNPT